MRKIELNMNEQNKYEIIKNLVDTNGNKKRAAIMIGCSLRNVYILINNYKKYGKIAFSHKNKNRQPKHTISKDLSMKIIDLYKNKYFDYNWQHFSEKLLDEGINISYSALYNLLKKAGFLSALAFKATKKKKAKEIEKKTKLTDIDKELILSDILLDKKDAHPRKPRAKYAGELIQMDACGINWFNDEYSTLHLAIDDSTGTVVGAYFDKQETIKGYYNVLYQILTEYGIPYKFLTDNRTIFMYKHKNNPDVENDTYTQFGYACKHLGIELETSSIPQRKGRIERLNGTFQRRLPQELRIASIKTIEQANEFLKHYIKKFNQRFALRSNNSTSVYENKPSLEDINKYLSIITKRTIDTGSSIKFNNQYYQTLSTDGKVQYFKKGTEVLVIKTFDNKLLASIEDNLYVLQCIEKHYNTSKNIDDVVENKPKNVYIPPKNHPWRKSLFNNHLKTIKHQKNNVNV